MIQRKTPATEGFFVKQYLANLKLTNEINDKMLKAVQFSNLTGEQSTFNNTLPDTRSITQKTADINGMKSQIQQYLTTNNITDGTNATEILSKLTNNEIVYLSNNLTDFSTSMKSKYENGVPSNIFLNNMRKQIQVDNQIDNEPVAGATINQPASNIEYINPNIELLPQQVKRHLLPYLQHLRQHQPHLFAGENKTQLRNKNGIHAFLRRHNDEIRHHFKQPPIIEGNGFSKTKSKTNNLTSFGKYYIHKKKLEKNVLNIYRQGGSIISSKHITPHLSSIVLRLMEKLDIDDEDVNKLSDEEKRYLHKINMKCELNDKLKIPCPDKTKEEQDHNTFEIMKGEILNGNTSIELIKKFKVMLLKMSMEGKLHKNQVRELLLDLTALGY